MNRTEETVRLLRECDAGVKMGIDALEQVLTHVQDEGLRGILRRSKEKHETLDRHVQALLEENRDGGKDPNPLVSGMSHAKSAITLSLDPTDAAITDLMTDGCNMGIKSLRRYLNQYPSAAGTARDAAKRLINLEEALVLDMSRYL